MVRHNRKTSAGFTLIELIVTVVIVSILAAIAIPSYSKSLARRNRAVAQRTLAELSAQQEAFFLRRRSYPTAAELLGNAAGYSIDASGNKTTTTNKQIYTITMAVASGVSTLTATAASGGKQAERDPECQTFTLASNGAKSATGSGSNPTATCWRD